MSMEVLSWELVNPEGVGHPLSVRLPERPTSLEGKKVGLAWNGKPGGDVALEQITNLLREQVKDVEFIRFWETLPESLEVTLKELEPAMIQAMADLKPDIVIAALGD